MHLRATVRERTGYTKHAIGTVTPAGDLRVTKELPVPAWVEIVEQDGHFYLLYFNGHGEEMTDTWHLTLDDAKAQAKLEFNIGEDAWEAI